MSETAPRRMPLDGVRVLDIATVLAAPFCATILGEFGAEVLKVEMPGGERSMRRAGTIMAPDMSLMWLNEGRNKKSITLDFHTAEGVALFKRLLVDADIVVENFRPGTLEKWGLGYDVMKSVKPDIILVRVSAYGQTGPYSRRPGFARIAHGFAGIAYLAGEPGGRPVIPGSTSLADYITGMYAAIGALMSYITRQRDGIGQYVDIGLYEGILRVLDDMVPRYASTGFVRERQGADTVNHVPHSHYETADGQWIALACTNDKMFQRLCAAMDRPDLLAPDRMSTMQQRVEKRDEINAIVAAFIAARPRDEILEYCMSFEVPVGPINNVADIFVDPHIAERGNLVTMEVPDIGPITVSGVLPRLSETPGQIRTLGGTVGAFNQEIYGDRLGLSSEDMDRLRGLGVI